MSRFVCVNGVWKTGAGHDARVHQCQAPLRTGPIPIPRVWAEEAYFEYARQYGTSQSLERLEERGGFGVEEVISLLIDALDRARGLDPTR